MSFPATLLIGGHSYDVSELTEFGFRTLQRLPFELASRESGTLSLDGEDVRVDFRIRNLDDSGTECSYVDLSISKREFFKRYIASLDTIGRDELEERSYDELAQGLTSTAPAAGSDDSASPTVRESSGRSWKFKSLAMAMMVLATIGLIVLTMVFLRSRSSLTINNGALVGNFLPINSKSEGEIKEVLVSVGQKVCKGDVLMRLGNQEVESDLVQAKAARDAAQAKVAALQDRLDSFEKKMRVAAKKMDLDLEVARAELEWADKTLDASGARIQLLAPYVKNGSITQLEYDEANGLMLAAEAQVIASRNRVKQLEFSQEAVNEENILILGDRVDDQIGRIQSELEIAKADYAAFEITVDVLRSKAQHLEIIAPRDGEIYTIYRQNGEFLKVADEAVALSYPGEAWAAGHVSAFQADRVRPGQPVTVSFPSLEMRMEGVVLAVGHRALYSKGHYNADFRGTTVTDVPVKVRLKKVPENVPSGMRMEMAINTGFGIKWLDEVTGYELKPVFDQDKSPTAVTVKNEGSDPDNKVTSRDVPGPAGSSSSMAATATVGMSN